MSRIHCRSTGHRVTFGRLRLLIAAAACVVGVTVGASSWWHQCLAFANHDAQSDASHFGAISGIVLGDGQPLPRARVRVRALADPSDRGRVVATDDDGQFSVSGLSPRAYVVLAFAGAYIADGAGESSGVHFVGEFVTINLTKGSVITGRVTDESGDPIVDASIEADRLNAPTGLSATGSRGSADTDDRGIYRIYGLPAGDYLVSVGSLGQLDEKSLPGECRIYYPSSTYLKAEKVSLAAEAEATGIDIQYRSLFGHTVSGEVRGVTGYVEIKRWVSISLTSTVTGAVAATGFAREKDGRFSFSVDAVPDGEYMLRADYAETDTGIALASASRQVTVHGSDLTNRDLALTPFGSISGKLVFVPDPKAQCKSQAQTSLQEAVVRAIHFAGPGEKGPRRYMETSASADGEFTFGGLDPGKYYIQVRLREPIWYVRSIGLQSASGDHQSAALTGNVVTLKRSEKKTGLTITVTNGAGYVSGRVTARVQANIPQGLRVLLVPVGSRWLTSDSRGKQAPRSEVNRAGKERVLVGRNSNSKANGPGQRELTDAEVERVSRAALVTVNDDGAFSINNLPPGKYKVISLPPEAASEMVGQEASHFRNDAFYPAVLQPADLARIWPTVEKTGIEIDVPVCGLLNDIAIAYQKP